MATGDNTRMPSQDEAFGVVVCDLPFGYEAWTRETAPYVGLKFCFPSPDRLRKAES